MGKFTTKSILTIQENGQTVFREATRHDVNALRQIYRVQLSFLDIAPDHLEPEHLGSKIRLRPNNPLQEGAVYFWNNEHGTGPELESLPNLVFFGDERRAGVDPTPGTHAGHVFMVKSHSNEKQWDGESTRPGAPQRSYKTEGNR